MIRMFRLIAPFLLLVASSAFAQKYVPDELQGWQAWVLKDRDYLDCPFLFDRGATDRADFVCTWPGRLRLEVSANGARFSQQWTVVGDDQWIALPGSSEHWPDRVTANGRAIEVVERRGVPTVSVAPGSYTLAGRFEWEQRPGVLRLPAESGLLTLVVDGREIERPELNGDGVFLGERKRDERAVDSVRAVVYRLVVDDVPTRLLTYLEIDVSGRVREESFGPILPDGFAPLSLNSELPARLEADGRLRLQVRPGRWIVYLNARGRAALAAVTAPSQGANLPDGEIWSYQSNDRLRVTAPEGLPPVDPLRVGVPESWQTYPAFRVAAGATLEINERSRGVVSATNELTLDRTMWLDFDGDGFIVQDRIGGQMRTGWRLDMDGPYDLLAATENDESLLITVGREEGRKGIEVRASDVALQTLGRSNTRGSMPATGWETRFAAVEARLNLPPGHKLLTALGVDNAHGSWAGQWRLLDFFLVLIITIAGWKLFDATAGVIALLALVLSYQEIMAPTWLWLNLLVAIALLRVAPEGRLHRIVRGYQLLSAAALVFALVPFIAGQLRVAIYPQLEPQVSHYSYFEDRAHAVYPQSGPAAERVGMSFSTELADQARPTTPQEVEEIVVTAAKQSVSFVRHAPNTVVQAGPGIPSWHWNNYRLQWSGPVDAAQNMRLVILPSWLVSSLRFLQVVLLLGFAGLMAAEVAGRQWRLPGGLLLGAARAAGVIIVCSAALLSPPAARAQTPDPALLQELERRLLEPPECVPRCAEIATADVRVGMTSVEMDLTVHALEDVAIPLPGSERGWRPTSVLVNDADNARLLRRADGTYWVRVAPGQGRVTLRGPLPSADSVEILFPTPARVINVASDGWSVAGVTDRRLLSGSLQLSRLQVDGGDEVRWESSRFPAFARVERSIELHLDWHATTVVYRVAPTEGALTLEVPLLEGETVVSGDFAISDGRLLVTMGPQQRSVSWTSNLERTSPLTLRAPADAAWQEIWMVANSSIWNVTFDGVPESNTDARASNVREAAFHPRAGEELTITAMRPEAATGSTLAFDAASLEVDYGNRTSDVSLALQYRSTRGAQHVVRLPSGAELTAVSIDGREQSLQAEAGELTLPILPGEHSVNVSWRAPGSMSWRARTPIVDLGAPASNIELAMSLPQNRWLLGTTGPRLGPAVLYWPELAALVLGALVLGRIGLAPLGTRHWLLLGLGFSTFSWPVLVIVAAWLFACGLRERYGVAALDWWQFNLVQVLIAGLTVVALLSIVANLPQGLLGTPDMHVTGHNSFGTELGWFADRSESILPVASAFTVPLWTYKVLILAWALWLSFSLVRWLPWVWRCFSSDGFWRKKGLTQE